jgi:ORMDL family
MMPALAEDGHFHTPVQVDNGAFDFQLGLPLSISVAMSISNNLRVQLPILDLSPKTTSVTVARGRGRSNSIVKVEEVGNRSTEEVLDRSAYVNINADWVNSKGLSLTTLHNQKAQSAPTGAWLIHIVLITFGKIVIDFVPGMTQQISWTLVNLVYLAVCHRLSPLIAPLIQFTQLSYLMFHWVTGIPFENDLHGGAYDDLTLWEQIDDGAQYTPAKKWLFCVPVAL